MKIQVITNNTNMNYSKEIDFNTFDSPMSFDNYDLNIIDLSYDNLWHYTGYNLISINDIDDFKSIYSIVSSTKKAIILYVFPKNSTVYWEYNSSYDKYDSSDKLKNRLDYLVELVLSYIIPFSDCNWFRLTYERNETIIDSKSYKSDFIFSSSFLNSKKGILTKSTSGKITTFSLTNNIILTTCDILQSQEMMLNYIDNLFCSNSKDSVPSWVREYEFYNDKNLYSQLEKERKTVKEIENRIKDIEHRIEINNDYKSILYSSGNQLVKTVFSILQSLLDVDLSRFRDVCKEDFIIEKNSIVFIGEIKGVANNVKYDYLSQTIRHFSSYADEHPDVEVKKIKPILIINPLRNTPVNEREPIHINQIEFSEKNNCLIIETAMLLKLYEKFLNNDVSTDDCVKMLFNNNGLLKL